MGWLDKAIELITMLDQRVNHLEQQISQLKNNIKLDHQVLRTQILKVKNKEYISNETILRGLPYNDLTPDKAYAIYNNSDYNYIILDVSERNFTPPIKLDNVIRISLSELPFRFLEITSRTIPVLIISENGVNSILACEFYVSHGFYNVINVSGGYEFWPGLKYQNITNIKKISA